MDLQNLPRWIWASLNKQFDDKRGDLPLYVEGHDRTQNPKNSLEFRLNGPQIEEPSNGYYVVDAQVNILVITIKDEKDAHKAMRNVGVAVAAFATEVGVYKYGDDRTALVGCLVLQDKIIVTNFGLVQDNVMASTVEGSYRMVLN